MPDIAAGKDQPMPQAFQKLPLSPHQGGGVVGGGVGRGKKRRR